MTGPRRTTRVAVAVVMTVWTALQCATLVVAAVRGGSEADAFRFTYTGMLCMVLVTLTVVAWRWVARANLWVPPVPEGPPIVRGPVLDGATPGAPDVEERRLPRHQGLSGETSPPRRW